MNNKKFRYLLLVATIALSTKLFAQDSIIKSRVLIVLNINSCSFCNKATNTIIDESLIDKVDFVFSQEDATPEQIDEFFTTNFKKKPRFIFHEQMFNKVLDKHKIFKNPEFIILDTSGQIVKMFPLDSMLFYNDMINAAVKRTRTKTEFSNDRIKRVAGNISLNQVDDYLFITGWSNTSKIYILNQKKNKLDSLYFYNNEKLIYKLLERKGVKGIDISEVKRIYKTKRLPYELISFNTRPYNTKGKFYNIMYVEYLDLKKPMDTMIIPELLFFMFSYDPKAKDLQIYNYKYWEKDWESAEVADDLRLDYAVMDPINDSLWMMGAEHIAEPKSDKKTFFYYANNAKDKELKYNGNRFTIKTDSMFTFDNEAMNQPFRMYTYKLLPSYLFYCESPYIYNYKSEKLINIRNTSEDIDWIYDMQETDNTLSILVQESGYIALFTLDKASNLVINKERLGKADNKGNVILNENGDVTYINKKGIVVSYKR